MTVHVRLYVIASLVSVLCPCLNNPSPSPIEIWFSRVPSSKAYILPQADTYTGTHHQATLGKLKQNLHNPIIGNTHHPMYDSSLLTLAKKQKANKKEEQVWSGHPSCPLSVPLFILPFCCCLTTSGSDQSRVNASLIMTKNTVQSQPHYHHGCPGLSNCPHRLSPPID